ncbi:MAG: phosphodiester glycosidase family protein, partial [Candidatus Thermofonsia bacterium]
SDNGVEIWPLAERPYRPDAAIQYGLQSFPMLVQAGEAVFTREDEQRARRTAVAVDRNGRLLFIVAEQATFTLAAFSHFLADSNLELETALNLDGGTSTGLLLTSPPVQVPAYSLLPTVITASPASNSTP